jgi:hypothetical protein
VDQINWILTHKEELIQIWMAIVTIASIVIKFFPPLKEDNPILPIIKFVGKYIALNTNAPKVRPI